MTRLLCCIFILCAVPGFADVVNLNGTTMNLGSGSLVIPSGRTIKGPGTINGNGHAIRFEGNGADQVIDGVTVNCGIGLLSGSKYTRPAILNCTIRASGTEGIKATIPTEGLRIEGNTFRDYEHYGLIVYHVSNASIQRNTFTNVMQGGHILNPDNVTISFNRLTGLTRMGFEVQRINLNHIARNITVEGNVIYDWKKPYHDSFGLSIVSDQAVNTRVINNYLRGNIGPGGNWHPQTATDGQGKRFGYGIEYGAASGVVSGNVVGGMFANHVVVSGAGGAHTQPIPVTSNRFYAVPLWRDWITTEAPPCPAPPDTNNVKDPNLANMPQPPPPGSQPAPPPVTQPATWQPNIRVVTLNKQQIVIEWDAHPSAIRYVVHFRPNNPADWKQVATNVGTRTATIQANENWRYKISVDAITHTQTLASEPIERQAVGEPQQPSPATQPVKKKARILYEVEADPDVEVEVIRK
jgi:hypothetical protein